MTEKWERTGLAMYVVFTLYQSLHYVCMCVRYLPWLKSRTRVFEGSGARIMIHKVSHTLSSVFHLPARGQWGLMDHPEHTHTHTRLWVYVKLFFTDILVLDDVRLCCFH